MTVAVEPATAGSTTCDPVGTTRPPIGSASRQNAAQNESTPPCLAPDGMAETSPISVSV
jgi:hypothetical protein